MPAVLQNQKKFTCINKDKVVQGFLTKLDSIGSSNERLKDPRPIFENQW